MWIGMSRLVILVALAMALALALPDTTEATSLNEIKKLVASDADTGDSFGWSTTIDGDTAIIGVRVPGNAAYVFERDQGSQDNWGEVKKLVPSACCLQDFAYSVAFNGDVAFVGAPRGNIPGSPSGGTVYVFHRDQGGMDDWGEVKEFTAFDNLTGDKFAISVAISGDTAVVGAYNADAVGSDSGAAYVFQRNEGGVDNWGEVTKLTASDADADDRFGISVTLSGDTIIVGAHHEDAVGSDAGAAYVFQRNQGGTDNWGEVTKLTASDAGAGDEFGVSVAISGDTAVVGSPIAATAGPQTGAAYVIQRDQGGVDNWGEVKKLTASSLNRFGYSVAVSADTVVVGPQFGSSVYVFQRNQGGADTWGEENQLTASDGPGDFFGSSVAASGDTALVGAWGEDAGGSGAGAAYVFDLLLIKPTATPTATPTPCPSGGCPVGGISLDSDLRSLPLETASPASSPWGVAVALVAAASLVGGGAAWYARRRA